MKKNLILGLTVVAVAGCMFTGCGKNKEVTKVDDTQAVVSESTESALEKDLEPATEAPTEVATEAPAEEVKADFLAKNGLTVTPNGSMTATVAQYDSDDLIDLPITTSVETVASSEEGYSDTTFTVTADISNVASTGWSYNVTAFDRYTGTSYEGKKDSLVSGGTTHSDIVVIDVDGTQYDCSLDASQSDNGNTSTITCTVHHPTAYDGVVFAFGKMTKTMLSAYNAVDFNSTFTVADYSDVYIDGQYFFTATDK